MVRAASFCASSRVIMGLVREQNVDLAKSGRRAAMADGIDLGGLALGVAGESELPPVRGARRAVARLPEIRRAPLVRHPRDHPALLPALDLPKGVAAELEIVALLVDGVVARAVNQYPFLHARNQGLESRLARARLQPDIRHTLERDGRP